nr:Acyl carrier protein [Paraburkholderia busanensis]
MSTIFNGNVDERVKNVVADQLAMAVSEVKPESNIAKDLGADSLDSIELVMAIEDEFGIEITDDEAEKLQTVQQVVNCASGKVQK